MADSQVEYQGQLIKTTDIGASTSFEDGVARRLHAINVTLAGGGGGGGGTAVSTTPDSTTGTISSGAGPTSFVQLENTIGAGEFALQMQAAAFTGTIVFEVSNDGVNYIPGFVVMSDGTSGGLSQAIAGAYSKAGLLLGGYRYARVRASAYTSGSLVVDIRDSYGTPLPGTLSTLTGMAGTSNPSAVLAVGALLLAQGASGNPRLREGTAATNTGAGALSVIPGIPPFTSLSAVTTSGNGTALDAGVCRNYWTLQTFGTAVTFSVKLQGSNDGTNYADISSAVNAHTITKIPDTPVRFVRAVLVSIAAGNITALIGGY